MPQYENREWTRFWCEKANNKELPRVLLIGDSITEGYYGDVSRILDGLIYADSITTSMAINHDMYQNGIKWFASSFDQKYAMIHFNNGLHGFHGDIHQYTEAYEKTVDFLLSSFQSAVLILATSTPVYLSGTNRVIDRAKNDIVLERNEAVRDIARKHRLTVDDLYELTMGNDDWRIDDGFHYNEIGRAKQAKQVTSFIKSYSGCNTDNINDL